MTNRIATVLLFLALCVGAISARATAVVTFTVSPNVVSNTYNSVITLQMNGLTNGVTNVVVQKFLDVNTNGVIDSGDLLVQQFRLAAGQVSVFTNEVTMNPVIVTNFMPGDISTVTNQMTVPLNFQNGDFAQTLVGQYLYRVSSPVSPAGFPSVTNLFTVTNAFFSTLVTGAVVNAASPAQTNIPNAIVLLCLNQNGPLIVQAGAVANSAGTFSLRAPPGSYLMAAAKSNFVEDVAGQPDGDINPGAKSTNSYFIYLNPATTSITGRVVNAASLGGLPGVSGMAISTSNLLSFYFTDTNGYFSAPVVTNLWEAPVDSFAAAFQGCFAWQTNQLLNVSNKVVNLTKSLPPATAIFYGVVSNSSAVPMPGVYLYATDNAGHQSIGMSDSHGKYFVGISAGTNQWLLYIPPVDNPGLTNPFAINPLFVQTGNLRTNQAVQVNFSLILAPYTISGTVSDLDGNPIVGAAVFAGDTNYQAFSAVTASDGSYTLNVSPGTWTVGVDAASLESLGFTNVANFPANQTVTISGSDVTGVNFSIEVCGEIEILTTNLPDAMVGQYYNASILGESCQSISNWSTAYGVTLSSLFDHTNFTYPAGTAIYSDSQMIGYVETYFSFGIENGNEEFQTNVTVTLEPDPNAPNQYYFVNISATVNVTGPITNTTQITFGNGNGATVWSASPTTQNGSSYSTIVTIPRYPVKSDDYIYNQGNFTCSPGTLVYNASVAPSSNRVASVFGPFHSLPTPGNATIAASSIPYTNLDNLAVWIRSGTNLGQYLISAYGPQTTNMDGLSVYPDGTSGATLSGTPVSIGTNGGVFNFSIMAEDVSSNVTVQPFSLLVFPNTGITGPASAQAGLLQSSNLFQMQLRGLTNTFNYTVLMSTNLASPNWTPVFTANNPATNSISFPDDNATNATRFYRVQISQ
jgi:Carboxypeptidase regulatory-like domain